MDIDYLVQNGLTLGFEKFPMSLWITKPRIKQCFRCLQFGHISKHCKHDVEKPVCARCGEAGHKSSNCSADEVKCINCKQNHVAWSKECPKRKKVMTKLRARAQQRNDPLNVKQLLHKQWNDYGGDKLAFIKILSDFVEFAQAELTKMQDEIDPARPSSSTNGEH